jgi:hypothetical protein
MKDEECFMNKKSVSLAIAALSIISALALLGCSVHANKNGDNKDVDIRSPFGSISVHAGDADAKDTGLPVYPGARPTKGNDDSDNANVNISSSMFGVKVAVQKFETDDSTDKVLGFYQKPMEKYGKVIQCNGGSGGGYHHHDKDEPVTCDNNGGHDYDKELKVGTENNQRIVAVKPRGKGSEFALIYVRVRDNSDRSKDTI